MASQEESRRNDTMGVSVQRQTVQLHMASAKPVVKVETANCMICKKPSSGELCKDCLLLGETHYLFICGMCDNTGAIERSERSARMIAKKYGVSLEEIENVLLICTTGCRKCAMRFSS